MQQGVVGDVAGRELFPAQLDAVKHLGRDDDGVLHEFFRVLGSDRFDGLRHERTKAWCDLFNEQISCLCCHVGFPPVGLQAAATTEDNAPAMRPPLVWCVPHGAAVNHAPEGFRDG